MGMNKCAKKVMNAYVRAEDHQFNKSMSNGAGKIQTTLANIKSLENQAASNQFQHALHQQSTGTGTGYGMGPMTYGSPGYQSDDFW